MRQWLSVCETGSVEKACDIDLAFPLGSFLCTVDAANETKKIEKLVIHLENQMQEIPQNLNNSGYYGQAVVVWVCSKLKKQWRKFT